MFGTTAFPAGIFASVSDLAERVQWILNNRHRPDGKLWKAKPLSKEAGLGETHVGMIARGDVTNVKTETVYAIARAAGVSGAWLLTGKGSPDEEIEDDSAYTSVTNRSVGHLAEPVAAYEPVRTRIADLPNVVELVERAKELAPTIPPWVWEKLLHMSLQLSAPASPVMLSELAAWVHRHEQVYRPREARPATGGQRAAVGAPDPEAESGMRRKVVAPDEASDEVETAVKVGRARRK